MSHPPRVLHLIHHLDPGGAEVFLTELLPRLRRRGLEASAACLTHPGRLAAVLEERGVPCHCLGKHPGLDLAALGRLRRLLRSLDIQILHTHDFSAGLWGRLAGLWAGTPILATVVHAEAGWWHPTKHRIGNQLLEPFTDAVVAVSQAVRDSLIQQEGAKARKIHVIHNGIDLGRFSRSAQRARNSVRLGLPGDRPLIGFIGRCSPEKGGRVILSALALLRAEGLRFQAVILGDGPERAALAEQARADGLLDAVRFEGSVPNVPDYLSVLHVVVCPSLQESFGLAALEAQAAGVPVIATTAGGFREILQPEVNALLAPPNDAPALAQALRRILRDDTLAQALAEAGRRNAGSYSIEKTADEYLSLYQRLLEAG